ncbi:hypothetical protein CHELA40_15004 [Chelatococcus asaccharovorans]|nr:hypothetical protein CHELA17_60617 [Chelatococcus asaccharovorans]CAH1681165.1 hypothetical protein CHELA40_15004 [Chelatococcus asaccharovorans]
MWLLGLLAPQAPGASDSGLLADARDWLRIIMHGHIHRL